MTGLLIAICTVALLGAVIYVVGAPLRAAENARIERGGEEPEPEPDAPAAKVEIRRQDLQAAREAKYREIRDAELDFRTGKLSAEDYAAIDAELRAEAVVILDSLEAEESVAGLGPGTLEQNDRVDEEEDREEDRPAV